MAQATAILSDPTIEDIGKASMRLDLVHPAVEKLTLVLEGLGGDKIRIDSTSLDQPLTVLPDQALEIVAIAKIAIATWIAQSA